MPAAPRCEGGFLPMGGDRLSTSFYLPLSHTPCRLFCPVELWTVSCTVT